MESYIDYQTAKENLSVIGVAEQLGYTLNRSEGLRYPVYELRQGSEIAEKIVITRPNDPSHQGYFVRSSGERGDLISFIEHRLDFFTNSTGTTPRERINSVLIGLLGNAPAQTALPTRYAQARQETIDRPFSPHNYRFNPINPTNGVALLEERGITRETLQLFAPFIGWAKEEGKPLYVKEMKRRDETLFSCYVAVDPTKKSISMLQTQPRIVQAEKQTKARKERKQQNAQPKKRIEASNVANPKGVPQEEKKQGRGRRV